VISLLSGVLPALLDYSSVLIPIECHRPYWTLRSCAHPCVREYPRRAAVQV